MKDFLANELQNRRRNRVIKFTILLIFILIIITTIVLTCVYFYNVNFRKLCDEKIINKEVAQSKVKSITINKDENELVIEKLLRKHPNFKILEELKYLPTSTNDGFYICKLKETTNEE